MYDPAKEAAFLDRMKWSGRVPNVLKVEKNFLTISRIHGRPLPASDMNVSQVLSHFEQIADALEHQGVSHNDIRPSNLIESNGRIHLIDFGWATEIGEPVPASVNPLFGGGTDRDALAKIADAYEMWKR